MEEDKEVEEEAETKVEENLEEGVDMCKEEEDRLYQMKFVPN